MPAGRLGHSFSRITTSPGETLRRVSGAARGFPSGGAVKSDPLTKPTCPSSQSARRRVAAAILSAEPGAPAPSRIAESLRTVSSGSCPRTLRDAPLASITARETIGRCCARYASAGAASERATREAPADDKTKQLGSPSETIAPSDFKRAHLLRGDARNWTPAPIAFDE